MTPPAQHNDFFTVGIGASAGGLEALEEFFKAMPTDSGLAFIVVVHLDPSRVSLLPELLQRRTSMVCRQITADLELAPNTIYVIPPNKSLAISNRQLQLFELELPRAQHLPIDRFFCSLANDQGDKAIAIILSGTGADGSQGLREIKAANGLVLVQDENSAKYSGMPKSAAATGIVDYVLPPAEMPAKILQHIQFPPLGSAAYPTESGLDQLLQKILAIVLNQVGHDFSQYKTNTLFRRIERRMQLHQIEKMSDYLLLIQTNPQEVATLAKELLIGVTYFFRDAEAFELLKTKLLPDLLTAKPNQYNLRVWVPGCSSGEEAYSLAIILQECLDSLSQHINVQIFGTDIDATAIEVARRGFYPAAISADVNPDRLSRFFIQEDNGYRIKKAIREMLVFALQNVSKDPPFTKLDLISCRNLLIYFNAELQQKVLPLFHYGLKNPGILFLGSSESIGHSTNYFTVLDKKWKLYSRTSLTDTLPTLLRKTDAFDYRPTADTQQADINHKAEELSLLQMVEAILRRSSAPPCAIIDSQHNILYVHGRLGRYLEPAEGKVSHNITEMLHPELKDYVFSEIRNVKQGKINVNPKPCQFQTEAGGMAVAISVHPILEHSAMPGLLLLVFEEIHPTPPINISPAESSAALPETSSLDVLQQELARTKENLQTNIEELETANEELKSANEELQSTNEELQSTNEELETSKEELQSLNEEAITVNTELQNRIDDYQIINDDLTNLFDSTQAATVFLDTQLCIRRYTPKAKQLIPLVSTDIGRPISHLRCTLPQINLTELCKQVLKTLVKHETKQFDEQGLCYFIRILPYRTTRNVIDGVIISFEDISAQNQLEQALINSEKRYKSLFNYSPTAIWEEDCSQLELALQQLRKHGITDLEAYLLMQQATTTTPAVLPHPGGIRAYLLGQPPAIATLLHSKRILEINPAALLLFKAINKEDFMAKLPQQLTEQACTAFTPQLLAIWNRQSHVNLEFSCRDLQNNLLHLHLTWIAPSEQGDINYANVMAAVVVRQTSANSHD